VEVLGAVRETILVVDSSGTRRELTNLLLHAGFDVRFVVDSATARNLTESAIPSVILLGLDHDEIQTLSSLWGLRRVAPDVAMIVLSSNTNVRTKARLLDGGADDYIEEPFEPLELLARVRSLVRRRKVRL
jgi:DNA-binding response OmpR family regulator